MYLIQTRKFTAQVYFVRCVGVWVEYRSTIYVDIYEEHELNRQLVRIRSDAPQVLKERRMEYPRIDVRDATTRAGRRVVVEYAYGKDDTHLIRRRRWQ